MLIINLIIIIIFFLLALISRKHFSKYKNVFEMISFPIYELISRNLNLNKKQADLRKINIVSDAGLKEICRLYYTKIISICMVVIFVINLACGIMAVYKQFNNEEISNIVQRGDYDDDVSIAKVYIGESGEQTEYELAVYPREYTYEEFAAEAQKVFNELRVDILANNEDLNHIKEDLNLPSYDEKGRFDISWSSDYPEYILPSGKVNTEEMKSETKVNLVAKIEYLDFVAEDNFNLVLIPGSKPEELSDKVGVVLKQIEADNRNSSSFELPDEVEGERISLKPVDNAIYSRLWILGIAICIITIVYSDSVLNQKKIQRNNMLKLMYPSFVNRMCLLMGAGMNIRNCLNNIIINSEKNILTGELEYTMNQIKSGYDEAAAYEELGIRIGIPQYNRLMSHISQNLRMGTRDLRMLMVDEVKEAMEERKEYAKKKGEKASTKLLFPMIILMAVVITIIMFPAFVGL